jgi:hypothetical protein
VVLGVLAIVFVVLCITTDPFTHHYRLFRARRLRDDLRAQFRGDPRFAQVNAGCTTGGHVFVIGHVASDADALALVGFVTGRSGSVPVDFNCATAGDTARFYRVLRHALEPTQTGAIDASE